ncbi:hypothetical protein Bca4012_068181 [Brassica carinata]|uniref:Uncharacterized protein n=1 Tax=Brassica carinata TaxID=52824 RepID=A0A8X8AZK1_BRACI|nr:hypothetical protein Bca52824_020412 [Brassica carinata]
MSAEQDDGDGPVIRDRRDDLQRRRGSLRQRHSWWLCFQSTAEMNKENEAGSRRSLSLAEVGGHDGERPR